MTIAFIGLGSNLEKPESQVSKAIPEIAAVNGITLLAKSSLYRSKPVGPQDQPDFINAVIKVDTNLDAQSLLSVLQDMEQQHGRIKTRHWGPRTLDLDILLFGNEIVQEENLCIPHPGICKRNFVIYPLAELEPGLDIPGQGNLSQLMKSCSDDIVRIGE